MRQERIIQATIFEVFATHEIGRELKAVSQWLDEHRALLGLASGDLRRHGLRETGRHGLPAEAVLRCGLLKQYRQLSYEELAFHLEDSASFRAFARLPLSWTPKKSVLHRTISAIRAETWEAINRILLASARQEKVETGKVVRLDSTVTAALMHEPSDSSLLWDAVRVMARLLKVADAFIGGLEWRNHRRAAKKRARAIEYARDRAKRVQHYRELIKLTRATLAYADQAAAQFDFSFTNVSSGRVVVLSVHPSCGCTTAQLPPMPWMIEAGTNGHIGITVNLAAKTGTLVKTVNVVTDKGNLNLLVRITILQPVIPVMNDVDRARALESAKADRQAVFRGDCATCHVKPGVGKYGKALYDVSCGICHESEHRATMVKDLHDIKTPTNEDFWRTWIMHGKPGSLMPAFSSAEGGPLNDVQINSLAAYLNAAIPSKAPPPPQ